MRKKSVLHCKVKKLPLRLVLLRQRFISSILLCAFAVLFAHSITPHHHHEEAFTIQHQDHHDKDDEDTDNTFLGHAFSHFQHDQDNSIVYETASPVSKFPKASFDKGAFLIVQYFVQAHYKPPLKHIEHPAFYCTSSSFSATSLLRGPPVALA